MRVPVILESPFAGQVQRNKAYLQLCILDCLNTHNESPLASHQMFTDALDDLVPEERETGIQALAAWRPFAQRSVVYVDFGISTGMRYGIAAAEGCGQPVEMRNLPRFDLALFYTERDAQQDTPWVELVARFQQEHG